MPFFYIDIAGRQCYSIFIYAGMGYPAQSAGGRLGFLFCRRFSWRGAAAGFLQKSRFGPHGAARYAISYIILHTLPVFKPVFLLHSRGKTERTGSRALWPGRRERDGDEMEKKTYKVGVVGATGMVGQRFVSLLEHHPWFKLAAVAASARSAGKSYEEAVAGRWAMPTPLPECAKSLTVLNAADVQAVAGQVDFVFCAVDMKKEEIRALEEAYARAECPVVSNNSANRGTPDVPMVVPEINAAHIEVIPAQRRRLGTRRGFIAVKSNCSLQSYVPALHPLMADFGVKRVLVCTYQAISGAGKTFDSWPEMLDNCIPYIGGEEEKSEQEPLKLWGKIENGQILPAASPAITAQCLRVPVSDGHMAAVFVDFERKPSKEEILAHWAAFRGPAQELGLPSAPKQFLHYFEAPDRPQTRLDRDTEHGMAVCIGRLREDTQYDYKFVCLSHNTLRGAAGGGVLLAELLAQKGYFD